MRLLSNIATAVVLTMFAFAAFAHDTWLAPSAYRADPGTLRFQLTSGMGFPELDVAIESNRVVTAKVRTRAGTMDLQTKGKAEHALEFAARVSEPGVAVAWVELGPRRIELKPEQVTEYLEEVGATESIGPIWAAMPEPKKWREAYTKHAKTFFRLGNAAGEDNWSQPVGMALELVPATDPTRLRAGDTIEFTLLENGKPLARFPVSAVHQGSAEPSRVTSDDRGRVRLTFHAPGPQLVRATKLTRSAQEGLEWESHMTTATFEVLPKRR